MKSIGNTLEKVRPLHVDTGKPDRADVENAFRTIIRWAGDDPERDGLIETPARAARAFEEYFAGYGQDAGLILQKTFEEAAKAMMNDCAARHPFREPLRASHGAYNRSGVGSICAERSRGWHQQARPGRGGLCQAPADSGKDDSANCQHGR